MNESQEKDHIWYDNMEGDERYQWWMRTGLDH